MNKKFACRDFLRSIYMVEGKNISMKSALLVVSFGTSYEETRKKTIEAIEQDLATAFPERTFYRAWTSERIRKKLRETRGISYDNVEEAMERMLQDKITDVLIQPTHMMTGVEFETTRNTIVSYRDRFDTLRMGAPLLAGEEDLVYLAKVLEEIFSDIKDSEMLALMGHGSSHTSFPAYELLGGQLKKDGYPNFCVGTVEYEPGFETVRRQVQERKPDQVYLTPLLVVAGDHAVNDMAGDSPDSWKSKLEKEGASPVCIVKGMGEYREIRDLYIEHARNAGLIPASNKSSV